MPRAKPPATRQPDPYERAGSASINATVARVAPAVLDSPLTKSGPADSVGA